ncbi:hypothetical protein N7508_007064 [Penicillium antarcticum]|uniref:uncharacterized protein n=1 Tax=Penicillium antarcticum TaxID=416450 RepID=UPI00239292A1|nr:uncharacterized protein N7508_007064 [Penicillium antarcticum]KAJ5302201.1 hypothetical protein N7508_007064 [Penicillium antarcticum]
MAQNDTLRSPLHESVSGAFGSTTRNDGVYHPSTKTALPDDGLYHPMRYAGSQNLPTVPNNVAFHVEPQTNVATETTSAWNGVPKVPFPLATTQSLTTTLPSAQETSFSRENQPTFSSTATAEAGIPRQSATLPSIPADTEQPDKSHVYAIISVLAVTCLIAFFVLIWLRKQKKKRTEILLRFHDQYKPPSDTSSLDGEQLKKILSNIKTRSTLSFETVIRSARKEPSDDIGTWATNWMTEAPKRISDSRNAHPQTSRRGLACKDASKLIPQAKETTFAVWYAISSKFKKRETRRTHPGPRESRTSGIWSATINSSAETFISPLSLTDSSHYIFKFPQPPTPAVLPIQEHSVDPLCLREVLSAGDEKVDQLSVSNGSSCTDLRPQLSTTSLFRRDVYHVDMKYESRNGSQLSLDEGQNVIITQILDDGWAYCQVVGSKKEGLAPRACISAWPVKRVITPPTQAAKPGYSPPRTPISPVSWAQPRFYAY